MFLSIIIWTFMIVVTVIIILTAIIIVNVINCILYMLQFDL